MVLAFAAAGADVVIASRKLDNCEALAEEVEATGRRALPVACHVGHWDECDALAERAYEHFGRVDILVNNAGMSPLAPSSAETSRGAVRQGDRGELQGAVPAVRADRAADVRRGRRLDHQRLVERRAVPRAAVRALRGREGGAQRAHQRSSRASSRPRCGSTRCRPGRSSPTSPSTGRRRASGPGRTRPAGPGDPEEVVTTALYLASAASSYTTGSLIRVDGGLY